MKKSTLSLIIFSSLIANSVYAQEANTYQHEVDLALGTYSDDFGDGIWDLGYRYYFTPVSVNTGPYALNGLLAQSSNIGARYAQTDIINESKVYHVDGTYVFDSKWFIGAMYAQSDDDSQYGSLDKSLDSYQFNLGYYFNDTSEVSLYYKNASGSDSYDRSDEADLFGPGYVYKRSFDYDANTYGIKARSFIAMESFTGIELAGFWQYTQADDTDKFYHYVGDPQELGHSLYDSTNNNHFVGISADFYLTKSWSVGGQYSWQKLEREATSIHSQDDIIYQYDDSDSQSIYSLNTAYWWQFSDSFAATASVAKPFNSDGDSPDGVFFRLGVNARF